MNSKDIFWTITKTTMTIVLIFELFMICVHNPAGVAIGEMVRKDGYLLPATSFDVLWSYIFPIFWGIGIIIFYMIFIEGFNFIWNLVCGNYNE